MAQLSKNIYSKNAIEFITVASEYVKFLEISKKIKQREFLNKIQKLLPLVYLKASLIPIYETDLDESIEKFVTEVEYQFIVNSVSNVLGMNDVRILIPTAETMDEDGTESVLLSECLADVYQDLKDITTLYQLGNSDAMTEALWDCKYNFENYWGIRLLSALSGIHLLTYNEILAEDEDEFIDDQLNSDDTEKENPLFAKFRDNYTTKN